MKTITVNCFHEELFANAHLRAICLLGESEVTLISGHIFQAGPTWNLIGMMRLVHDLTDMGVFYEHRAATPADR
jgi:hypothetical protein